MLGFGLILPLLPFYAEQFNASSTVVGLLVASYAAAQMIGAPLRGRAQGMGLIGAAFGLGFIIGPAVGGLLRAGGQYSLPAYVAAGLTALNLIAAYICPIRFQKDLRITVQALGWHSGKRYLPLQDDIATTAFWYQTEPHAPFPTLPDRDFLEVI